MLISLTPNTKEIEGRKLLAKELKFKYKPRSMSEIETGIYDNCLNFPKDEFMEKLNGFGYMNEVMYNRNKKEGESVLQFYSRNIKNWVDQFGVADNIEQIKKFYKKQIADKNDKFIITIWPIYQHKANKGKGGGWRWHKWGRYIGKLKPKYEYLDDEEFGDDFECVLVFQLHYVEENK